MKSVFSVALAVGWRMVHNNFSNPSLMLPGLAFPLFFFVAFAGGLSRVNDVPGFQFPVGYTAFQFVFVLLQSAAFAGVFTGFGIVRDFETGFARRLLLAAPDRRGILLGYAFGALGRWTVTVTVLTVVALAAGMQVGGDGVDIFALYALALLVNGRPARGLAAGDCAPESGDAAARGGAEPHRRHAHARGLCVRRGGRARRRVLLVGRQRAAKSRGRGWRLRVTGETTFPPVSPLL
jgi:hypothetical protein